MKITINVFALRLRWHYSIDGSTTPHERSEGYDSKSAATRAAIGSALVKGPVSGATGDADRKVIREAGIILERPAPPPKPEPIRDSDLSRAKLSALATARDQRASARQRTPPEGYRSVEHFLDAAREHCEKNLHMVAGVWRSPVNELAEYMDLNKKTVWRWLKKEKIPMQENIDLIHRWLLSRKAGL